jgi:hypothetical protein
MYQIVYIPSYNEKKAVFSEVTNLWGSIVIICRPVRFLLLFSEIIKMATRGRKTGVVTQTNTLDRYLPQNIGETENFCATLLKDLLQDVIISFENVVRPLLSEI